MIIGSGMLATALASALDGAHVPGEGACLFACGVSDSTCIDPAAFARERSLLQQALRRHADGDAFVYFGTCSAGLPAGRHSPYVRHKLQMEQLVAGHRRGLVLRLPQLAGPAGHPNGLLNYLRRRIVSGEEFDLWQHARRSIIDVRDAADAAWAFVEDTGTRGLVVDVATPVRHRIDEIVLALEQATGCRARCRRVARGHDEPADITMMRACAAGVVARFDADYLQRTVLRYHGTHAIRPETDRPRP